MTQELLLILILYGMLKANNIKEPERFIGERDQALAAQERIDTAVKMVLSGNLDYTLEVGRYDDHAYFINRYQELIRSEEHTSELQSH